MAKDVLDQLGSNMLDDGPKQPPKGMPKTVKIMLEENDDIPPTGLYVGHNGKGYMIRPGEPVDCPECLLEILDHAVKLVPNINPQTRRVEGWRPRLRFPYRRLSDHPPHEPARAA